MTLLLQAILFTLLLLTAVSALRMEMDARAQPERTGTSMYLVLARTIIIVTGITGIIFASAFYII